MKVRPKLNLAELWLLTSFITMILHFAFLSTAQTHESYAGAARLTVVTLYVLSFPFSVFGLPVLFFAALALGVEPDSPEGMHLNLCLLFVMGLVQWFWIYPRLESRQAGIQTLSLPNPQFASPLSAARAADGREFWDAQGRTPLERVFAENDFP